MFWGAVAAALLAVPVTAESLLVEAESLTQAAAGS